MAKGQCICSTLTPVTINNVTNYSGSLILNSGDRGELIFEIVSGDSLVPSFSIDLTGQSFLNLPLTYYSFSTISTPTGGCTNAGVTGAWTALGGSNSIHTSLAANDTTYLHICTVAKCATGGAGIPDAFVFTYGCIGNECDTIPRIVSNVSIVSGGQPELSHYTTRDTAGVPPYALINYSYNGCDSGGPSVLTFRYHNDGNGLVSGAPVGFAKLTDLKIYLTVTTRLGDIDTNTIYINSFATPLPSSIIKRCTNGLCLIPGLTGVSADMAYYEIDFSSLPTGWAGSSPFGANTLADIDGDGNVDDVNEGNGFELKVNFNYNASCPFDSPDLLTTDIAKELGIYTTEKYNNQCHDLDTTDHHTHLFAKDDYLNGEVSKGYIYRVYEKTSTIDALTANGSDVLANEGFNVKICPNFDQVWTNGNFLFDCPNGYYRIHLPLPAGYHLDTSSFLLSGISSSPDFLIGHLNLLIDSVYTPITRLTEVRETKGSCITDTTGSVDTTTYTPGYINIDIHHFPMEHQAAMNTLAKLTCLEIPLKLSCDCAPTVLPPYPFRYTDELKFEMEFVCCDRPDSIQPCADLLARAETHVVHHCPGFCNPTAFATFNNDQSPPFSHHPFTFLRTSKGFVCPNTSATAALPFSWNCSAIPLADSILNGSGFPDLKSAYPGDAVEAKIEGQFKGVEGLYSNIYLQMRYDTIHTAVCGGGCANAQLFELDHTVPSIIKIFHNNDTVNYDTVTIGYGSPLFWVVADTFNQGEMNFKIPNSYLTDTSITYHFVADIHLRVESVYPSNPLSTGGSDVFFTRRINDLLDFRAEYMGMKVDSSLEHSCDDWGANFTILQPVTQIAYEHFASDTLGCAIANFSFEFINAGARYSDGQPDFPNEFRPYSKLGDTVSFDIPPHYTLLRTEFTMTVDDYDGGNTAGNLFLSNTGHWSSVDTISPCSIAFNGFTGYTTYTFSGLDSVHNCFPLLDCKNSQPITSFPPLIKMKLYMQPDCDADTLEYFTVKANYVRNYQNMESIYYDTTLYTDTNQYIKQEHPIFTLTNGGALTINNLGHFTTPKYTYCATETALPNVFLLLTDTVTNGYFSNLQLQVVDCTTDSVTDSIAFDEDMQGFNIGYVHFKRCFCFQLAGDIPKHICVNDVDTLNGLYYIHLSVSYQYSCTGKPVCNAVPDEINFSINDSLIIPNPTVTVTSDTVCKGTLAYMVAGGAATYVWSAGATAIGIDSASAAPSTTQTYTVTGIASNGCKGTAVGTVLVYPTDLNVVAINYPDCLPGALVLWATGAYTYSWSPAPVSQTVDGDTANFGTILVPNTYTVTATTINGCVDSTTLTVNSMPCTPETVYPDYRFCLFDRDDNISLGDAVNSYVVTYPVSIDSVSKVVPLLGTGFASITGSTVKIQAQQFGINGSFYVDQNLILKNCDIKLGELSEIVLLPHDTLTILGSYLRGCDTLWDGIKINGKTEKVIIKTSVIEDAVNAISSAGGGHYEIDSTIFNKNSTGMLLTKYSGTMQQTNDYNLHHSVFTCRNFDSLYTVMPIYSMAGYIIADYSSNGNVSSFQKDRLLSRVRSFTGIEIQEITYARPIPFGDSSFSYKDNIFDYLDYGIRSIGSNMAVWNNVFENITHVSRVRDLSGTAIYAIHSGPKTKVSSLIVGGMGTNLPNEFDTCTTGVYSRNLNDEIIRNEFLNINSDGVYIDGALKKKITINENNMNDMVRGVVCYDMGSDTVAINENHITLANLANWGIYAGNPSTGASSTDTTLIIFNNVIDIPKEGTGIEVRGMDYWATVDSNEVNFTDTSYATGFYCGISIAECDSAVVKYNTIRQTGVPVDTTLSSTLIGISVDDSPESYVYKNILINMGSGIYSTSSCNNSMFACNFLDTCAYGFNFDNAVIGDQFPGAGGNSTGNEWYSNTKYIIGSTDTINWHFISGLNTDPYPTSNLYVYGITFDTATGGSPCDDLRSLDIADIIDIRERRIGKIVRNQNNYDTLNFEFKMRDSIYAYGILKSDTTLLSTGTSDDTLYNNFYDYAMNSNIGKFQQIKDLGYNSQANIINQNVVPTCLIEENQKTVNSIYLSEVAYISDTAHLERYQYDSTEISVLEDIAYQNPMSGGDAVFMARIMLFIDIRNIEMTNRYLSIKNNTPLEKIKDYKLYPNPNDGNMILEYSIEGNKTSLFSIYDMTGRLVKQQSLSSENKTTVINAVELSGGAYYFVIKVGDEKVKADKLIIVK